MGSNAVIRTDPLGSVTLSGDTVSVRGSIFAPAGNITITGRGDSTNLFGTNSDRALTTVYLSAETVLSATGAARLVEDGRGFRTGTVFPGGTITVTGNLLAERGALLDVSGTSAMVDLPPQYSSLVASPANSGILNPFNSSLAGRPLVPTRVDSDGGSIALKGGQLLFSDATLIGHAGGPSAYGGSIDISASLFADPQIPRTPLDVTLTVTQSGNAIPKAFGPNETIIGQPVIDRPFGASGGGHVTADSFTNGGFDCVNLRGVVKFDGPISLASGRELHVADGGVLFANDETILHAPYVALGTVFQAPQTILQQQQLQSVFTSNGQPFYFNPTFGRGRLMVQAELIDLGNLSLQGIGKADFTAGAIRGDGTLDAAGAITLQAAQVYPATAVNFTIAASDRNITVASSTAGNTKVTLTSAELPPGFGIGSPLLGGKVVKVAGNVVTLDAGANATVANQPIVFAPGSGSVRIVRDGLFDLPLSAGGTLSIYGSHIDQDGALFAPGGTINLGWDGTGSSPKDFIAGAGLTGNGALKAAAVAVTQNLNLGAGSVTSVALADPRTGAQLLVPYGLNLNGSQWIDPFGTDITAGGVAQKAIHISGVSVNQRGGSLIDISGGGDLYSYQWIPGPGGSMDVLATTTSFAVLPGYDVPYAPYAPYASSSNFTLNNPSTGSTFTDPGYVNAKLQVGDSVHLGAGAGLPDGNYTLLPARYALLPGAFLVTPQSTMPVGTFSLPDGSNLVSGFRFNPLSNSQTAAPISTRFEVVRGRVLRERSAYGEFRANDFLTGSAQVNNALIPRLPGDAGYLLLEGRDAMTLAGEVRATGLENFHGGLIDISSSGADITIGNSSGGGGLNHIVLDSTRLSGWGAESLLIGGKRTFDASGANVTVTTNHVTVDNAGTPLSGTEIILVANKNLTLADGAQILQDGTFGRGKPDALFLGNSTPGSGDGVLFRLTSDPNASTARRGVNTADGLPTLAIGSGVVLKGNTLLLDSTAGLTLQPSAQLDADHLGLNAGRIVVQLDPNVTVPNDGLLLTGPILDHFRNTDSLSLLSYRSLDIYGAGTFVAGGSLSLHAAEIRGFENSGGISRISAASITIDNSAGTVGPGPDPLLNGALSGTLQLDSASFRIGSGALAISQFQLVDIHAPAGLFIAGSGSLTTLGDFSATTPFVTGAQGITNAIVATGKVTFTAAGSGTESTRGLGATFSVQGSSVVAESDFIFRSGSLTSQATGLAATDGVTVGGHLDVSGTAKQFYDLTRYTSAGDITLASASGNVTIAQDALLDVSADPGGGNPGSVSISAPNGDFVLDGKMLGKAGSGGTGGSFALDVHALADTAPLAKLLTKGGFNDELFFRVRTGDVSIASTFSANSFSLSTDAGSILLLKDGVIDASGATGGTIRLVARQDVVLENGSLLTVEADDFNHAGKGGAISLESGAAVQVGNSYVAGSGFVNIQAGAKLNLGVKSTYDSNGAVDSAKVAAAQTLGKFTGTLHLRAPQTGNVVQIDPVAGTVLGSPSKIVVEGYKIYQPNNGALENSQGQIIADGNSFANANAGLPDTLFGAANPLKSVVVVTPGAEIVNSNGDLTLNSDWDLSTLYRFGVQSAPGVLTLRAIGNLVFNGALSDGFTDTLGFGLFYAPMMSQNPLLPVNAQSWSYRMAAGADLTAVDFQRVRPLDKNLPDSAGSLLLGRPFTNLPASNDPSDSTTSTYAALLDHYQVIRTGSGDIEISAARDLRLLNPFATIYTAGTQVANPHRVIATSYDDFEPPTPLDFYAFATWAPQYSLAGGNISISAQGNIKHQKSNGAQDSERQLPINWLYRRGIIGPDGKFARTEGYDEIASTSWWTDFGNFFEGIGTMGGGNITLNARGNIENVDAAIATNARMAGKDASGNPIAPSAANLIELGGGDLTVKAGQDINGGVYYVERGNGRLQAGNSIHTNSTRAPQIGVVTGATITAPEASWLPTTLFLGKGSFDVSALGDIVLGPVVNPFLVPPGELNNVLYRTYFSTYSPESAATVSSVGGDIHLRDEASTAGVTAPMLQVWMNAVSRLLAGSNKTVASFEPWIRLSESSIAPFKTSLSVQPGTLQLTAFTGDINLAGQVILSPAPHGTFELLAGGAINGLSKVGSNQLFATVWDSTQIIVSDADPANIPGITSPTSVQYVISGGGDPTLTRSGILASFDPLFAESGSTSSGLTDALSKKALHDAGLLHIDDSEPLRLYSLNGNIADLTLFSPKQTRLLAGADISDVGLYLQNVADQDISVVSAGHDIIAYNPNSVALKSALRPGSITVDGFLNSNPAQSGDLQITGPGTLEILAGRKLDLGSGRNTDLAADLGQGITSAGNARNPALPLEGARLIVAAGVSGPSDLSGGTLEFKDFIEMIKGDILDRYLPELTKSRPFLARSKFDELSPEQQATVALDVFYLILRDAGRSQSASTGAATGGGYADGFAAIDTLFGKVIGSGGDILLNSHSIKTSFGGDINLLAPAGGLSLGYEIPAAETVPPGIITEAGGNISIFARDSVQVGALRIFTLRGGNEIIWSSKGDIAAGSAAKTVKTAPPTRVVIDAQSADVSTDLAGLATGGGIGVLATRGGVAPGDVDLIAPTGVVDAGDAGIRATGNLNIAATQVLNADNIQVAGTSTGVPAAPVVAAPNLAGLGAGNNAAASASAASNEQTAAQRREQQSAEETPSIITVEVLDLGPDPDNSSL